MFLIYLTPIFKKRKPRFQKASNLFQVLESTKQEGPGMRQGDQAVSESHIFALCLQLTMWCLNLSLT